MYCTMERENTICIDIDAGLTSFAIVDRSSVGMTNVKLTIYVGNKSEIVSLYFYMKRGLGVFLWVCSIYNQLGMEAEALYECEIDI